MSIRRFDLEARGLARVVGELEARILEAVWELGRVTVKDVTAQLGPDMHLKTVMTVTNRMVDKALLVRERQGRAYYYEAASDRESFMAQVVSRVLDGLAADFGRPTLAHFVDAADPEQIAELEEALRKRRDGARASDTD
jgi:predicted transcriptional regulator